MDVATVYSMRTTPRAPLDEAIYEIIARLKISFKPPPRKPFAARRREAFEALPNWRDSALSDVIRKVREKDDPDYDEINAIINKLSKQNIEKLMGDLIGKLEKRDAMFRLRVTTLLFDRGIRQNVFAPIMADAYAEIAKVCPDALQDLVSQVTMFDRLYDVTNVTVVPNADDPGFNEAILAGVIDSNPATPIKPPAVKIQRHRLTFEQWQKIRAWSVANQPPWVARLLDLALVTGQRRSDLVKMRFADVWEGHLHIEQFKTSTRLALPIALHLDVLGKSIADVIEDCRKYAAPGETLVRRQGGVALCVASLSARFEEARDGSGLTWKTGSPPSLHECRSLSERLYRAQGIDTMTLLGHRHQSMTDIYNDDRGLSAGKWKTLVIAPAEKAAA
jgi:integrase